MTDCFLLMNDFFHSTFFLFSEGVGYLKYLYILLCELWINLSKVNQSSQTSQIDEQTNLPVERSVTPVIFTECNYIKAPLLDGSDAKNGGRFNQTLAKILWWLSSHVLQSFHVFLVFAFTWTKLWLNPCLKIELRRVWGTTTQHTELRSEISCSKSSSRRGRDWLKASTFFVSK